MNPRTRALITVGLVIATLTLFFLFIFIKQQKQTFTDTVHSEQHSLQVQMELLLEQTTQRYKSRIKSLATNRVELIRAFSRKDRTELLKMASPLLKILKKENPYFRSFFFANPDNTIFLRTARPELYGDDITLLSPLIFQANQNRKMMTGFEITKPGLNYRIIYPVFEADEYIGIIGFSINADFFLDQLHHTRNDNLHHNSQEESNIALVFPKAELNKVVFHNKTPITIDNYVIFANSNSHFLELPDHLNFEQKVQQIKLHGKSHALIQIGNFKNFKGSVIAMGLSLIDIESIVGKTKQTIVFTVIFSLSLLLISFVIIYFNFNILFKKVTALNNSLAQSNQELEHRVEERTADLKESSNIINRSPAVAFLWANRQGWPVEFVSENVKDLFGFTSKYFTSGKIDYADVIHPGDLKTVVEEISIAGNKKDKIDFAHKPYRIITKNGDVKWLDHRSFIRKNQQGVITHYEGLVIDITNQKKLEQEKQGLMLQVCQTQKMEAIGTLAGGIAHDFNNILSGIFGYSQLAKMNIDDPEKTKNNLEQIVKGAQKATDLVKQILTFSRKSEHEMHPLKIFIEVKEAIKLLRSTIPSTIEIQENIVSKAAVLADLTQVHQVVMNLCTNAYHAMMKKGGVLSVDLNEIKIMSTDSIPDLDILPGNYLKLEISDTGSGMNPETLDKIFEPYFTTKEPGEGTGLGLAVVLGIVKEHNGFIKAYSKPGKGSSFHVYFPIFEDQINSDNLQEKKDIMQGGTEKIMLVDDEIAILETMQGLLENYGYTVMAFLDGEHAFKEFKKDPDQPDLIITDMAMPRMTGKELASQILKIRENFPIILCTGYSENFTQDNAFELGISKYVNKPVESKNLLALIREVLDEK